MDTLETIYSRRSIRKFKPTHITQEIVTEILRAAMSAPTAGNQRPWQFIIIRSRPAIEKIIDAYSYATMLRDVPVAIMVCFDKELEKYKNRWQIDCANAMLSILLAAHGLGYGGLWLEIYPIKERIEKIRNSFGLPDTIVPFSVAAIGQPDEEAQAADRYDETIVHFNKWGKIQ
jgi:nitroreductase